MSYGHVDGLPGYAEEDEEPTWKLQAELDKVEYALDELQAKIDELEERRDELLEQLRAAR